jgi:uncharacterized delta-60 repeat protein
VAWCGPGDLDPGFGDVGRVSDLPEMWGRAWSLDVTDAGILFGGYEDYCEYCSDPTGFTSRLGPDGAVDPAYAAVRLQDTDVREVVVQPDGKPVAIGTGHVTPTRLVLYRLNVDGSLDTSFDGDGIVEVPATTWVNLQGTSLVLDPGGRIVVAGLQGDRLLVMGFLADGTKDTNFGSNGSFVGSDALRDTQTPPKLVRVGAGGYRVMVNAWHDRFPDPDVAPTDCRVVALTSSGALDAAYGTGGFSAPVNGTTFGASCSSIGAQSDGRVVVAGHFPGGELTQGFVSRLLSTGAVDSLFADDPVSAAMSEVTALAVAGNDSVVVAGHDRAGLSGALVMRLQADGHLDAIFGRDGTAVVDVESDDAVWPTVHDMQVLPGGAVVMSGSTSTWWSLRPFVARLLGDSSGGSPGVLDVEEMHDHVLEADQSASVAVRRIGGRSGPVSVAYRAEAGFGNYVATAGADFTVVEGWLSWPDGDDSVRTVTVPIASDDGPAERPEVFRVQISAPEGGAGLATSFADVTIAGDSFPAGVLVVRWADTVYEGHVAHVAVGREDYGTGPVSVDVMITGGSAALGGDYSLPGQPMRLSWGDGDRSDQILEIPTVEDRRAEPTETIAIALTGATGGALIGAQSTAQIEIMDDDAGGGGGGGGGRAGVLFVLLSSLAGWLHSRRRAVA